MPNRSAKTRKRNKRLLNDKFSKQGRTRAQRKRHKLKIERQNERRRYRCQKIINGKWEPTRKPF